MLTADEFPGQIDWLPEGLSEHRGGQPSPLSAAFGNWLKRALQLDTKTAFQTPSEMQLAFEAVLASDRTYVTTTAKFEEWIANVGAAIEMRKRPPAPEPPPPEPEPQAIAVEPEPEPAYEPEPIAEPEPSPEPEPVARAVEEVDPIVEQIASYKPSYQEAQAPEPVPEPERKPAPSPVLYDISPVVEDPEITLYIPPPIVAAPDPVAAEPALSEPAAYEEPRVSAYARAESSELRGDHAEVGPEPAVVEYVPAPPVAEETEQVAEEAGNEAASTSETAVEAPSIWAAVEAAPPADPIPVDTFEPPPAPARSKLPLAALAGVIALLLVVIGWLWMSRDSGGIREGEGELAVQSRPPGARVIVDGKERGVTPTTVRLPAGAHVLEVQVGKAEPRVIPLTIATGVQTSQYIELRDVAVTGSLSIKSDPSGARITIDGQPRGTTPATIPNLTAGDHAVVLELAGRKASQAVKIEPGTTAQLTIPMPRR